MSESMQMARRRGRVCSTTLMAPSTKVCLILLFLCQQYDHIPVGSWHDDLRSGHGKYTYANGDEYEGEWLSNVREGTGSYTYSLTGSKVEYMCFNINLSINLLIQFEGAWARGKRSGNGQYVHLNHKFAGSFVDDLVCDFSCINILYSGFLFLC